MQPPHSPLPNPPQRERWSSQAGFVIATIGSAVGLGNIWRFPYVAGENGGGAFVLAYLACVVLLGAPLMMFEMAAGRLHEGGPYATFRAIRPAARLLGAGVALVGFAVLSYYLVVAGWTLGHIGIVASGAETTFEAFAGSWAPAGLFLATLVVSGAIVYRGVSRGIELASRVLLPLLVAIVVGMAAYGLTFDGRAAALEFLYKPDVAALLEPRVWAAALAQAFFSLSVGTGILIAYGSYMQPGGHIRNSTAIVAAADTGIALLAGLAIFPIVFTFGVNPGAGPALAFDALPRMFGQLPFGQVVGAAFYVLLFVAATTSAISMIEVVVVTVAEWRGWERRRAVLPVLVALVVAGGMSALSYSPVRLAVLGRPVLDVLDSTVGVFGILAGALMTAVAVFWIGRPQVVAREIGAGARGFAGTVIVYVGRYVIVGALVAVLVASALGLGGG